MPLYDFACPDGHVTESRQGQDVKTISCPCGKPASKLSVYRFNLGTGMPTRYRVSECQEAAAEAHYYHEKMEEERGHAIPRRPLVNMAADQARRRGAKVRVVPKGV